MTYAGGFFSITYMQDMTTSICNEATTPATTATTSDANGSKQGNTAYIPERTLVDKRDGNSYIVRKMPDGNCWMAQNLELTLSTSKSFTNKDTDLNSKASWTPENSTETTQGSRWGEVCSEGARSYSVGKKYFNGSATYTNSGYEGARVGIFYNWCAATASQYKGSLSARDATDSICPYNWRLPPETGDKSMQNLFNTKYAAVNKPFSDVPYNIYLTGYYEYSDHYLSISGLTNVTVASVYQTTHLNSGVDNRAYNFQLDGSGLYKYSLGSPAVRGTGFSIRCVAR